MDILLGILLDMHPDVDFAAHEALIDDRVIDSFDIITLVAEINDRLDVAIPAEELIPENFNSLKALHALVSRLEEDN